MRTSLAALLMLAACTPMQWVREGGALPDPEAFERDVASCRQQAWREAQFRVWTYQPIAPIVTRDAFGRRIVAWPYSPYPYPYGDPFFEEARLTEFCLRAKGYELAPLAPRPPG